ncbi:exopolysaccharide biosynthesis protein [Maritimibacter sp. HL-12]|uniref:exopolysaccharide biosynthesis protein n=1 Tax=Maritimibacter sp. HL-12 TaxID=1162418 RepID=UPI000A0F18BA|nr:exopolysaccharide biosynthesis protein [Maritimibacter sp. HL-12]SMH58158.1 Uncharacterized conserved protein [Maritimibacter sp. HL-12]
MQDVADMLDRLDALGATRQRVTLDAVRDCLGRHAFTSALLTSGLLALSPLGDLPGTSAILGGVIAAISVQMLLGRSDLWLPPFLLRRGFAGRRLCQAARVLRPAVRILGVVVRRRLAWLTAGAFERAIAAIILLLALTLPPLEIVPFGATVPSSVITLLAVSLFARDGLLALLSLALMVAGGWFVVALAG